MAGQPNMHEGLYQTFTFVVRTPGGPLHPDADPRSTLSDDDIVFWGAEDGITDKALALGADPSMWHDDGEES